MPMKRLPPPSAEAIDRALGDRDHRQDLLDRVEDATAGPLTLAAIVLLAVFLAPAITPNVDILHKARLIVVPVVWFLFAASLAIKIAIAPDRKRYLRAHVLDVLIVALPIFHPLMIGMAGSAGLRGYTGLRDLRGKLGLGYTFVAAVLVVLLAAALVTEAERGTTGATIRNFGDAVWWASATVTTVGYGDVSPITATGRAVGLALMVVGIATFGLVAANLATILLGIDDESRDRIDRLEQDLDEVRDLVAEAARRDASATPGSPDDAAPTDTPPAGAATA